MSRDWQENIKKALDVSGAASALVQIEVDKVVAQLMDYKNPLRQNLPRKKGSGDAWYIVRRTPGSTGAAFVDDTDNLATLEETGSYQRVSFPYKTLATRGKVTRKLQRIGMSYIDVLAAEIEAKTLEFRNKEDYAILMGDSDSNSKEFDGLDKLCKDYGQTVVTTSNAGGAAITLAKLDEVIDKVTAGEPDMIICSRRTRRQLTAALQASQRFVNTVEVKGGFKLLAYNGIPIYVSTNIPDTGSFDGSDITWDGNGDCSALYVVSTDHVWVGVLTDVTVQPLAKTTTQYDEFEIIEDFTLVVRHPQAIARLVGISS